MLSQRVMDKAQECIRESFQNGKSLGMVEGLNTAARIIMVAAREDPDNYDALVQLSRKIETQASEVLKCNPL